MAMVGVAHAKAGRVTEARASLAALTERSKTSYVSTVLLAQLHSALGDLGATLDALERARDARATDLVWIGVRPAFDAVRIDPRFEALVRQMGLSRSTVA
jgi:hypothetical protein